MWICFMKELYVCLLQHSFFFSENCHRIILRLIFFKIVFLLCLVSSMNQRMRLSLLQDKPNYVCTYISPAKNLLAAATVDVIHCVEASYKIAILIRS